MALSAVSEFGTILYYIVLPILLLAGVGYLLNRTFRLDMKTLARINFTVTLPGMVFFSVVTTSVSLRQAGLLVGCIWAIAASNALLAYVLSRITRTPRDQRSAFLLGATLQNAGNYGLPLEELAFRPFGLGAAAQGYGAFYVVAQNLLTFSLGVFVAAGGRREIHWREQLRHIVRFPPLYALAAAIIVVIVRGLIGDAAPRIAPLFEPLLDVVTYVKSAFVCVALLTMGGQLAEVRRTQVRYPVGAVSALRLVASPVVAYAMVRLFGIEGLVAQVIILASATPTAVNAMLLCMEFDNHPDFAARAVFLTTVLSPPTIAAVVFLLRSGFFPGLAL